jgi:alkylated DNA repair dioxygenase AlkB
MWISPNTDLFSEQAHLLNLLPKDGVLNDYGRVMATEEGDNYFTELRGDVAWQPDSALLNGRLIKTAREVAWYADSPFRYIHSGVERQALQWQGGSLLQLKRKIEELTGQRYNSCLLNLYHDGSQGIGWHADVEAIESNDVIASLSLGAARKFALKHKATGEFRELTLEHGQVIVMRGETQRHWLHSVMKTKQSVGPRISLTFRCFPEQWRTQRYGA